MIRAVLVDDEEHALNELEYLLKKEKNIEIVGAYTDPITALEEIRTKEMDAIFLDIDMPVLNGLNIAKEIVGCGRKIDIIFVTAFNEYAVKAFEIHALDYILKPIDQERLSKTVERLRASKKSTQEDKNAILKKINSMEKYFRQDISKIAVSNDEEMILVKASDILFLEAQAKSIFIVTKQGKYKSRDSLEQWENRLKDLGFFRCHRSFLVNLRYIVKISPMFNNNYIIKQEGSLDEIPVSRNQLKELKQMLGI